MGDLKEELSIMQEKLQLHVVEQEKEKAIDELKEMKKVAKAANMRLNEEMSTTLKVADINTEYNTVKESLKKANQELSVQKKHIDYLKIQLGKRKELEKKLEEKDSLLVKLKEELSNLKTPEAITSNLLSDCERRVEILETELDKEKKSGEKLVDAFCEQTKQLEETKVLLEEAKLEIGCLHVVVEKIDNNSSGKVLGKSKTMPKGGYRMLDDSDHGIVDIMNMLKEREFFKNELKLAMEAEENSKKAMDDLALALKEVATEAKEVKECLLLTKEELEEANAKVKKLKLELHNSEASFKVHLMEARKETDRHKNTAARLRMEADETLLTWTGKETGFVKCVKKVEEEKSALLEENHKLHKSLVAAENMIKAAKEETKQVRDILKQAVNKANVDKEAAGIVQSENSQLKDALVEKDNALNFISHENESLKINEATANENIKELKRLLSEKTEKDPKSEKRKVSTEQHSTEKERKKSTEQHSAENKCKKSTEQHSTEKECKKSTDQHLTEKESKKRGKTRSVNLKEIKIPNRTKITKMNLSFQLCSRQRKRG